MAQTLLETMVELLHYISSEQFDRKTFAVKSKNFADLYKRADQETQGEYHHLWHEYLK